MEDFIKAFIECDSLVGRRFNYETLQEELNQRFSTEGTIQHEGIAQFNPDYQLTYVIDDEHCFDIYYLKMRERSKFDGADIYITEIGSEIY